MRWLNNPWDFLRLHKQVNQGHYTQERTEETKAKNGWRSNRGTNGCYEQSWDINGCRVWLQGLKKNDRTSCFSDKRTGGSSQFANNSIIRSRDRMLMNQTPIHLTKSVQTRQSHLKCLLGHNIFNMVRGFFLIWPLVQRESTCQQNRLKLDQRPKQGEQERRIVISKTKNN